MTSSSPHIRDVVPPESLAGKKVLVMGLGRFGGGVGVSKWLVGQEAAVTVNDASPAGELAESIKQLEGLPITFKLGGHQLEDFLAADLLVLNPAVDKKKSEVVQAALAKGVPYTTEMNLFVQRCRGFTIGITGSVGKSTTTALVYEALKAGLKGTDAEVFLGGNIGRSLLLDLPKIRPQDVVVLELSSFMLEETPRVRWSPNVAVVTNIFPNHLDRHNSMAEYSAAKQNILKFQGTDDVAIFNNDHELVSRWAHFARWKAAKYSTRGPRGKLPLLIPGEHNQSNAAAAVAVLDALPMKVNRAAAIAAIQTFPGLAHRLALVHSFTLPGGRALRFYDDSKATSPDASITALQAFEPSAAIFIVGGYDKHIDLSPFETLLAERAGGVIGIGQTGEAIINHVRAAGGGVSSEQLAYAETLERALPMARQWAEANPLISAVVLSPASASWGQFANYEKRGERFIELSRSLPI
jgi:UDP-N-acetylmuramoylalanine--D-glutamate ligase